MAHWFKTRLRITRLARGMQTIQAYGITQQTALRWQRTAPQPPSGRWRGDKRRRAWRMNSGVPSPAFSVAFMIVVMDHERGGGDI